MEHTVDEIREIIGSDSEMAKKINSMPYNLQLEDLMGFFNFCESTTRKLTHQPGFPYMKTGISKILIPRPLFLEWYYTHCFYRKWSKTKFDKFKFNYLIFKNHWFFKASRLFSVQTLSVCPRFCPYEPKQGQFFIPRRPPYPAALRKYASLPL